MAHIVKDKQATKRYEELCKIIKDSSVINPFETQGEKTSRIAKVKIDFKEFVGYYFAHYSDSETPEFHVQIARRVRRNPKYKVWLKWARGHAKSVVAIILLPLWLWINGEINFLLVVGQNEKKAQTLLGDLQAEFEFNQRLINDFGPQKLNGSWEDGFFTTKSGFIAKAIGMGQDPRGIRVGATRPDYIVADDWEIKETVKNAERQDEYAEWFLRGVIPAMDNKNRRVLICQNHFAPRMIFSKIVEENKSWQVHQVNAYHPVTFEPTWKEKYTAQFWKDIVDEIGTLRASAEYNNEPHVEGKLFTDDMIQWTKLPSLKSMISINGRWDIAYGGTATSDFNAIRVWGLKDGKKYLIDCFVKQSKIKDALIWIAEFQRNLNENISIQFGFEAQFWNEEIYRLIAEVEHEYGMILNLIKIERRKGNKYDAIIEMLPQYQSGRVYYNEQLKSHNDTQVGIAQLKGIAPGYKSHDDAPDADKYSFDELDKFDSTRKFKTVMGKKRQNKRF